MRRAALLLVALTAVPATVQAQLCIGQAPWSAGSVKLGGAIEIGGDYTDVLGGVGFGKDGGFFFGAGIGLGDNNQVLLAGGLGKELSTKLGSISICPVANLLWGLEKDDYSFWTLSGGLAGGYPLGSSSENLSIILTGAGQLGLNHFNVSGFGGDTDILGIFDAGVGLVFNNQVSVVPGLRLYIGDETDLAFVVRANIAVGK